MKKTILLFISLIALTTLSADAKGSIGVLTGFHITNAEYVPREPVSKQLYGIPMFGLYSKLNLTDNLAIQLSPSYTRKKFLAKQYWNIELESGYWELPILLSYEFDLGMAKPYVFAGPNLGYIVNPRSITYYDSQQTNEIKEERDISSEVETIEFAIKAGFGLELEFDSFTIFGQVHYSHGLNNLYNAPKGVIFPDEVYLRSFGAQAGISFPFGRR